MRGHKVDRRRQRFYERSRSPMSVLRFSNSWGGRKAGEEVAHSAASTEKPTALCAIRAVSPPPLYRREKGLHFHSPTVGVGKRKEHRGDERSRVEGGPYLRQTSALSFFPTFFVADLPSVPGVVKLPSFFPLSPPLSSFLLLARAPSPSLIPPSSAAAPSFLPPYHI